MDFPLTGLLDEDACYARLVRVLHPDGLACPRCGGDRLGVHRRHRAPVLDYRCRDCRRAFNAFTGTALRKTARRPSALLLILRGFAQGASTARRVAGLASVAGSKRSVPRSAGHEGSGARCALTRPPVELDQ